jgi:hypothetical protein
MLARYHLIAHKTQSAVGGYVTIYQVLYGTKIGNNDRWPASSDKYLMAIGLGLSKGHNSRRRNLVALKAHQGSVYVIKQSVARLHYLFF